MGDNRTCILRPIRLYVGLTTARWILKALKARVGVLIGITIDYWLEIREPNKAALACSQVEGYYYLIDLGTKAKRGT
jgi:hypothetical protein